MTTTTEQYYLTAKTHLTELMAKIPKESKESSALVPLLEYATGLLMLEKKSLAYSADPANEFPPQAFAVASLKYVFDRVIEHTPVTEVEIDLVAFIITILSKAESGSLFMTPAIAKTLEDSTISTLVKATPNNPQSQATLRESVGKIMANSPSNGNGPSHAHTYTHTMPKAEA